MILFWCGVSFGVGLLVRAVYNAVRRIYHDVEGQHINLKTRERRQMLIEAENKED